MAIVARWLGAFIAATLAYLMILTVFVMGWAQFGGDAQNVYMFGMSFSVFAAILLGTVIVPRQHRKLALWLFIVLMWVLPLISIAVRLAMGATFGGVPWLDIAGTFAGSLFAPFFARSAIKGCEPKTTYPVAVTHPWMKNLGRQ